MALHLVKLCVGVEEPGELARRQHVRRARADGSGETAHITRMEPRRQEELLDGGSLYWIMKGHIRCRQRLLGLESFRDAEGTKRCRIVLASEVVRTRRKAHRPFQGWRYLKTEDAPADAPDQAGMPETMREELEKLGLL